MPSKTKFTDDTKIAERLKVGQRFVARGLADRDRIHCKRFLDGSQLAWILSDLDAFEGEGVVADTQEVGSVNYLTVNVLTKVASVAIGDPDFHVECDDDDEPHPPRMDPQMEAMLPPAPPPVPNSQLVRQYMKDLWKHKGWARVARKALLKRSISGAGCVAYLWHSEKGPVLEHVRACDIAIDPNVVDWQDPRWAARRVRIPREEAIERYPKYDFGTVQSEIQNLDEPRPVSRDVVELYIYWDSTTEAVCHSNDVLEKHENLYEAIPLIFLEGDIAPETEFSLGDFDGATGLQTQLTRLGNIINSQAEHGGAIGWYNPGLLTDESKDAFEDGTPQGFVAVNSDADRVFGYIPGEPMNPAVLEAFKLQQAAMDSFTGVSEYQRGVISQSAKFATEAALLANQSGARGNQARIEYEQFIDRIARAILDMTKKFAPSLMDPNDPDDTLLFTAISSVTDICVLESSTSYKDPAQEIQQASMLLQSLLPFVQAGIVNPIPLITDVLRANGKRDVNKYLTPQAQMAANPPQMAANPQQPPPPPGVPATGPGGAPGGAQPPVGAGSPQPPGPTSLPAGSSPGMGADIA